MKRLSVCFAVLFSFVLINTNTFAQELTNPWLVRVRPLIVSPSEESTITVIGGQVTVDKSIVPELDISYFFTEKFAVELILGVTKHNVAAVATAAGDIGLGHVFLLPPTLTAQYHPFAGKKVRPFIGTGLNYTVFFGEDPGTVATAINYKNSFSFALQGGVDIRINDTWAFNFDVKKLFLNTDVRVNALDTVVYADVDIKPWIIGSGIAYKFR